MNTRQNMTNIDNPNTLKVLDEKILKKADDYLYLAS